MIDINETIIELGSYFPIEDNDVTNYISNISSSMISTFEKEEYQFSYFSLHLMFMTYVYCSIWKISKFHTERYKDSLLFARLYNGSKVDLKNAKSVFDYSHLPEKDIFDFFSLIELDNGYIKSIKDLVDKRNNMAHATGNIEIRTLVQFEEEVKRFSNIFNKINSQMENITKSIYETLLIDFSKNKFDRVANPDIIDIIDSILISEKSFSLKELCTCTQFGTSKFSREKGKYGLLKEECLKIKDFHTELVKFYEDKI